MVAQVILVHLVPVRIGVEQQQGKTEMVENPAYQWRDLFLGKNFIGSELS